jgi:hypothetical protein
MQRTLIVTIVVSALTVLALGSSAQSRAAEGSKAAGGAQEQPVAKSAPANAEAVTFLSVLCERMGSGDARIRFAAREALVVMGTRAASVLKERKASEQDPHVKAFIDRTVKRIKSTTGKKGGQMRFFGGRDIDRIAMSTNLSLAQIAQLEPVLAKHDKDVKSLWAEFKESGGFRDPEAYKDVMEEIKALAKESEPNLKFLDDKQRDYMRRAMEQSSPFGGSSMTWSTGDTGTVILGGPGGGAMIRRVKPEK